MMQYVKYVVAGLLAAAVIYAALMIADVYTPEYFAGFAGAVISLVFEYFPGLRDEFDQLSDDMQRIVMIGIVFLSVAIAFAMSCLAVIAAFACTSAGALDALWIFILAVIANQGAFLIAPKKGFVARLKAR